MGFKQKYIDVRNENSLGNLRFQIAIFAEKQKTKLRLNYRKAPKKDTRVFLSKNLKYLNSSPGVIFKYPI